jgi:hypothetical protein
MWSLPGDLLALILKLVLGTAAFAWILWSVRGVNPRAVGMTLTFPALNGVVLLTATDKVIGEMVIGIIPLMLFNGLLPALFIALRRGLGDRQRLVLTLCLLLWAILALVLEWPTVWPYRRELAAISALLLLVCAGFAFFRLRTAAAPLPPSTAEKLAWQDFLRDRAPRIFWFFVSLAIVSGVAYAFEEAHSLVGRLSSLPLVPLFVLHWAVNERRIDLGELRLSAVIGPLAAGTFLVVFALSLGLVRSDTGELHPGYWPLGLGMLLIQWELTRRLVLGLSRLTYRG